VFVYALVTVTYFRATPERAMRRDLSGFFGAPMTDSDDAGFDLEQIIERFPDRAALVTRLAHESEAFRSLCDDFTLAWGTLARLDGQEDRKRHAAVISDYIFLVAELERDIAAALDDAVARG
jgi:hypothetical protein